MQTFIFWVEITFVITNVISTPKLALFARIIIKKFLYQYNVYIFTNLMPYKDICLRYPVQCVLQEGALTAGAYTGITVV